MHRFLSSKSFKPIENYCVFLVLACCFSFSDPAGGISRREMIDWTRSYQDIHQKKVYPFRFQEKKIQVSKKKLFKRMTRSKVNETIEPLNIYVDRKGKDIFKHAEFLADKGHIHSLAKLFKEEHPNAKPLRGDSDKVALTITENMMRHIDVRKMMRRFRQKHYSLELNSRELKASPMHYRSFFEELSPFLRERQIDIIKKKVKRDENVPLDEYLLTDFARKMVGKYILYRGPNCFHASLAFHHLKFARSPFLNINQEKKTPQGHGQLR